MTSLYEDKFAFARGRRVILWIEEENVFWQREYDLIDKKKVGTEIKFARSRVEFHRNQLEKHGWLLVSEPRRGIPRLGENASEALTDMFKSISSHLSKAKK